MANNVRHRGFSVTYDGPTDRLVMPITILPVPSAGEAQDTDTPAEIIALWDTGAMSTCIKPALRDRLALPPCTEDDSVILAGVGGEVRAGLSFVNIQLPQKPRLTVFSKR